MRWQQNVHNRNFVEFLLQLKSNCYLKNSGHWKFGTISIYAKESKIWVSLIIIFLSTEIVSLSRM